MSHIKKPWLNKNGELFSEEELKTVSMSWNAAIWEDYLKSNVEHSLQESLPESDNLENLELDFQGSYKDMLAQDDFPNLKELVGSLVKKLTVREREVIFAIFWQGKSQHEVANILKLHRSLVRNCRDRALRKLGVLFVEKIMSNKGLKDISKKPCPPVLTQNYIGKRKVS